MSRLELPPSLGPSFATSAALELGVGRERLRANDLEIPFRGVRMRIPDPTEGHQGPAAPLGPYERARHHELSLVRALAQRRVPGQFFSHRSAALVWGAPLPHKARPELHLSVHTPDRAPRVNGVIGHELDPLRCPVVEHTGLPITSAARTWALLGALSLEELVAVGDYMVRQWRAGYRRRHVGRAPLATIAELTDAVAAGRWRGSGNLKRALPLIREDAWSPMETRTRLMIVLAGLPEPELNVDLYDEGGWFLGCSDLVYRKYKIAIEYQGVQHAERYADDIERIERLRAAGWIVIQITKSLIRNRRLLVERVAAALRERGWRAGA